MIIMASVAAVCFVVCLCAISFITAWCEHMSVLNADVLADFTLIEVLAAQGYSQFEVCAELCTAYFGHAPKKTRIKIGENFKTDLRPGNFAYHTNEYSAVIVTARDKKKTQADYL